MEHFPSNRLKKMIAAEERISEQKDISLQNWGACVDAVFLARVKRIMEEGNANLRNGSGTWRRGSVAICYRLGVLAVGEKI